MSHSYTESAEKTGHIKYIVQFIEKGKKKKKKKYSESKLVKFLPASEYMKNQKEQGLIILAVAERISLTFSPWGYL